MDEDELSERVRKAYRRAYRRGRTRGYNDGRREGYAVGYQLAHDGKRFSEWIGDIPSWDNQKQTLN